MTSDSARPGAVVHAGRLLVAAPSLIDPNFARSVVLVCDASSDGAIGLILNRPTESSVADFLPMWEPTVPALVFIGGPVQPEVAVGLVTHRGDEPVGFTAVVGTTGLFDLATPHELVGDSLGQLRVFSGYAGWGPGQLEGEVAAGDWVVVDAEAADLFTAAPETLWRLVLRRQGGEIALLAGFPDDPSLN